MKKLLLHIQQPRSERTEVVIMNLSFYLKLLSGCVKGISLFRLKNGKIRTRTVTADKIARKKFPLVLLVRQNQDPVVESFHLSAIA